MFRLKELRHEKQLTQKQLAEKLGVSQQVVGYYENGINQPAPDMLIQIANFFECSIDYLLGRSDDFGNVTVQTNGAQLSADEQKLLDLFNTLSPTHKAQVLGYVQATAQFAHPSKNILGRTNK